MKIFFRIIFLLLAPVLFGQSYEGEIFIKDKSDLYLNQFYVTNINNHHTVLANYNGEFKIPAKAGDIIRFTSIATERKDITVTAKMMERSKNYVELEVAYHEIQEVVVSSFRPTGNLRKDVTMLKASEKAFELRKMIGLPEPKGDGTPPDSPITAVDGRLSLSVDSFFELISGERKKKERLYKYEKMSKHIDAMQKYFGDDYFVRLKIPKDLIPNFLQFVYSSDNISIYLENNNYEATKIYIEKYLPIYLKRLRNSNLMQLVLPTNVD